MVRGRKLVKRKTNCRYWNINLFKVSINGSSKAKPHEVTSVVSDVNDIKVV